MRIPKYGGGSIHPDDLPSRAELAQDAADDAHRERDRVAALPRDADGWALVTPAWAAISDEWDDADYHAAARTDRVRDMTPVSTFARPSDETLNGSGEDPATPPGSAVTNAVASPVPAFGGRPLLADASRRNAAPG